MPGGASAASPNWCQTSKTAASPREPLPQAAPCAVPSADPTALIRLGSGPRHQALAGLARFPRRLQDGGDLLVGHHLRQAVAAQQQTIVRLQPDLVHFHLDARFGAGDPARAGTAVLLVFVQAIHSREPPAYGDGRGTPGGRRE